LVECAFPNDLQELAEVSHHLTPNALRTELQRLQVECPVYVINMKPMYREKIIAELSGPGFERVKVLEVGKVYDW
jgi:hypothetical protein